MIIEFCGWLRLHTELIHDFMDDLVSCFDTLLVNIVSDKRRTETKMRCSFVCELGPTK